MRSAGGYAANVEAYTTRGPGCAARRRASPRPSCSTRPNTPTIATLVDARQRPSTRATTARGRPPTPSRTSCSPSPTSTGRRELVIVGLPGDRDVDMKRAEVAVRARRGGGGDGGRLRRRRPRRTRQGLHRPVVCRGRGARREVDHGHPLPARPPRRRRHRVDHGRQRAREARVRPRRRPRLRRRRRRARSPRCVRATPLPTAPARSSSLAAWRSATSSSSAASMPRRSASRCSTRTASSSPSRWAPTASA